MDSAAPSPFKILTCGALGAVSGERSPGNVWKTQSRSANAIKALSLAAGYSNDCNEEEALVSGAGTVSSREVTGSGTVEHGCADGYSERVGSQAGGNDDPYAEEVGYFEILGIFQDQNGPVFDRHDG